MWETQLSQKTRDLSSPTNESTISKYNPILVESMRHGGQILAFVPTKSKSSILKNGWVLNPQYLQNPPRIELKSTNALESTKTSKHASETHHVQK